MKDRSPIAGIDISDIEHIHVVEPEDHAYRLAKLRREAALSERAQALELVSQAVTAYGSGMTERDVSTRSRTESRRGKWVAKALGAACMVCAAGYLAKVAGWL